MPEAQASVAARAASAFNLLRWILCGLCVLLVVAAVLVPPEVMSWLRRDYARLIGRPMSWLDHASSSFDLTHVVLFIGVGFLVSCLWPRVAWWRLALAALGLAVGSELLQFWAPGREPRLGDAYDDLLGAGLGLLIALPFRWLLRRM